MWVINQHGGITNLSRVETIKVETISVFEKNKLEDGVFQVRAYFSNEKGDYDILSLHNTLEDALNNIKKLYKKCAMR